MIIKNRKRSKSETKWKLNEQFVYYKHFTRYKDRGLPLLINLWSKYVDITGSFITRFTEAQRKMRLLTWELTDNQVGSQRQSGRRQRLCPEIWKASFLNVFQGERSSVAYLRVDLASKLSITNLVQFQPKYISLIEIDRIKTQLMYSVFIFVICIRSWYEISLPLNQILN